MQVQQNNVLRPVIDPVFEAWKRENRGKKDAIVEAAEDSSSKAGNEVPAIQLGLPPDAWDIALEVEGFLDQPYDITSRP